MNLQLWLTTKTLHSVWNPCLVVSRSEKPLMDPLALISPFSQQPFCRDTQSYDDRTPSVPGPQIRAGGAETWVLASLFRQQHNPRGARQSAGP